MPATKMVIIDTQEMKRVCTEYTRKTGVSLTDLSARIGYPSLLNNAITRGKFSEKYKQMIVDAFGFAGIDVTTAFTAEKESPQTNEDDAVVIEIAKLRDDLRKLFDVDPNGGKGVGPDWLVNLKGAGQRDSERIADSFLMELSGLSETIGVTDLERTCSLREYLDDAVRLLAAILEELKKFNQ